MTFPNHPFFQAAALARRFSPESISRLKKILGLAFVLLLLGYLTGGHEAVFGLALIALGGWGVCALGVRFIAFHRGQGITPLPATPELIGTLDLSEYWPRSIDFASAEILWGVKNPDDPQVILTEIFRSRIGRFFFSRTGFAEEEFWTKFHHAYHATPHRHIPFSELLPTAARLAIQNVHPFITPADLLAAIHALDMRFSQLLIGYGLGPKDFGYLAEWLGILSEHRKLSFLERVRFSPGIGKTWAYGYTPFLDRHSRPVVPRREDELHIPAHRRAIAELEAVLAKGAAANALIVGEPGIGKMSVVKGLAARVWTGQSLPELKYRRVVELLMPDILSHSSPGGDQAALGQVFREAEIAGNVILVIEDIELYLIPGLATHLTEAFQPFLRSPLMKVIGVTTPTGYEKCIAGEPALGSLFHEIRVEEPNEERVIAILADAALAAEARYHRILLYPTLKTVYEFARRYITDTPFPEKAVTLLEELFLEAQVSKVKRISPDLVEKVLERRFGVPLGAMQEKERILLADLEVKLHRRVINQNEAISALADAIRRKRTGVAVGGKPVGSFLFLGPTGVGKTETAKALAEAYYGAEENMIRLDMAEYQNPGDIGRLIGSPETHGVGFLAEQIRAHPFSLLLLDEIEKAHPNVLNLFLRILDEGRATDAYGKRIDFTNAIIVGTSNAGSEFIRQAIITRMAYSELKPKLLDEVLRTRIFEPEFVNRFDAVIVYTPLDRWQVKRVAELALVRLKQRLAEEGYALSWSPETLDWLARQGYSPVFGGRELRRVIQDRIESPLARDILAGKHRKGDTITLAPPD